MTAADNLLIVEDDSEWCDGYSRAAAREGIQTVKAAKDLAGARALIDDMQFAIAFVDIGLNVGDDQNVDGLRVMEKIRAVGDPTSIVVVTGRSGRDVLPITRDAIMTYQAHHIVGKPDIKPKDIRDLMKAGLKAFEEKNSTARAPAHDVLRGSVESWKWDDQMLSSTGVQDGVQGLYDFVDQLAATFLPLVAKEAGGAVSVDDATGIAHGSYWSRSIGAAVVLSFGAAERFAAELEKATSGGPLLGRYKVDGVLRDFSGHGLAGAVLALKDGRRDAFAGA